MVSLIIPAYHAAQELYDRTIDCLDSVWDEDVQLILIAANQPYTVNVNNGLKAAMGDTIVVANNDLIFPNNWLFRLTELLDNYDIATCWTSDQNPKLSNGIEENAKFGSIFAMKRTVYETLGDFDEQFKGYFSDLDYRQRALEAGFKIGKRLDLVIEHEAKATYRLVDPDDTEYHRSKALYEAKWGFIE